MQHPAMKPAPAHGEPTTTRRHLRASLHFQSRPRTSCFGFFSAGVVRHGHRDCCPQGYHVLRGLFRCGEKGSLQNARSRVLRHRHEGAEGDSQRQCQARGCLPDCFQDWEEDRLLGR